MPSARRVTWAKFRVAVVGLVGGAILGTLFYLLTGGTLLQEKTSLYLYIPDGTGVGPGSPVRVDGIDVGKVRSVGLTRSTNPDRVVKVTITVEREHLSEIPADSTAKISSDTLIGDKFVDIDSGTNPARIKGNSEIPHKEPTDLLKRLDIAQFEQQLRSIDAVLSDIEQGRSRVGQFVMGERTYNDLVRQVSDLEKGFRSASDTTSKVGQALYTSQLYDQASKPLRDLDRSLARLQGGQGQGGRLLRDSAQYDQLRAAAANFRRSITDIHAGPFVRSDAMYTDWNHRVAAVIQSVDEMNANPVFATTDWYDRLTGAAKETAAAMRELRQNPKKYLRLKIF